MGCIGWLESLVDDTGEPGHIAATWLTSLYLEDHNLKGAKAGIDRMASVFDGEGLDKDGRRFPVTLYTEAFVDEAVAVARSIMEGPTPAFRAARDALQLALAVSGDPHAVPAGSPILAAQYYANVETAAQLLEGIDGVPAGNGPRVIVFTDDFQLGEPVLPSVLKRWSAGITVGIVGRLTGHVRRGMRRSPVKSDAEEREVMSAHAKAGGLAVSAVVPRGGAIETRLGLPQDAGAVVFVLDKSGKILARMSGNALDPRPLDVIVAGLVADPYLIAPPK
jgi:hypothetical protein